MEKQVITETINKALLELAQLKELTIKLQKSIKYHTYRRVKK